MDRYSHDETILNIFSTFYCKRNKGLLRKYHNKQPNTLTETAFLTLQSLDKVSPTDLRHLVPLRRTVPPRKDDNKNTMVSVSYMLHYAVMPFANVIILVQTELLFSSFVINTGAPMPGHHFKKALIVKLHTFLIFT
jgi:hypothetical protein